VYRNMEPDVFRAAGPKVENGSFSSKYGQFSSLKYSELGIEGARPGYRRPKLPVAQHTIVGPGVPSTFPSSG